MIARQQKSRSLRDLADLELKEISCKADMQLLEARRDRLDARSVCISQKSSIVNPLWDLISTLRLLRHQDSLSPLKSNIAVRKTLEEIRGLRLAHTNHQTFTWRNFAALKAMTSMIPNPIDYPELTLANHGAKASLSEMTQKFDMVELERDRNLENISLVFRNARWKPHHFHSHRQL
jgi:hypothetical protein